MTTSVRDAATSEQRCRAVSPVLEVSRGLALWSAGKPGVAWRLEQGIVCLFFPDATGAVEPAERLAMLALPGDLVGVEAQFFGHYAFDAVALTPVVLSAWAQSPQAISSGEIYWRQAQRAHDVARLRSGRAEQRLRRLLELLHAHAPEAPWPRRRDIAAVTGLTIETVSRLLSQWREEPV